MESFTSSGLGQALSLCRRSRGSNTELSSLGFFKTVLRACRIHVVPFICFRESKKDSGYILPTFSVLSGCFSVVRASIVPDQMRKGRLGTDTCGCCQVLD